MDLNIPGVEVISATPVFEIAKPLQFVALFFIIFSAVMLLLGLVSNIKKLLIIGAIGYVLCGATGILTHTTSLGKVPTGEYQYIVSADESVSINDILSQFDLVGQSGENYIIQSKP